MHFQKCRLAGYKWYFQMGLRLTLRHHSWTVNWACECLKLYELPTKYIFSSCSSLNGIVLLLQKQTTIYPLGICFFMNFLGAQSLFMDIIKSFCLKMSDVVCENSLCVSWYRYHNSKGFFKNANRKLVKVFLFKEKFSMLCVGRKTLHTGFFDCHNLANWCNSWLKQHRIYIILTNN